MVGRISSDVLWDTVVGESVLELIERDAQFIFIQLIALEDLLATCYASVAALLLRPRTLSLTIWWTVLHARQSLATSRSAISLAFCWSSSAIAMIK
jgi:hypothetical protein